MGLKIKDHKSSYNAGKKSKLINGIKTAFTLIDHITGQNPIQVLVDSICNAAPREETTKIAMGGTGGIAGGIAGGGVLGRAGRIAGQVAGRLALPLAAGGAAYGAYQGYTADESASFGQKLLNAGSSALNFTTMGLLGSSREEIINRGTKPQSQGIEGEFGAPCGGKVRCR